MSQTTDAACTHPRPHRLGRLVPTVALAAGLLVAAAPALAGGAHGAPVVDEVDHHFDEAAVAYDAGDMERAADELRIAGSYVRLEAQRVDRRLETIADRELRDELRQERRMLRQTTDAVFDMARDLGWFGPPSAEELEELFLATDHALARYHHRRAAEALRQGEHRRASLHMQAVAEYLEHGLRRSGTASGETAPMAERTRRIAKNLGASDQARAARAARSAGAHLDETAGAIERIQR